MGSIKPDLLKEQYSRINDEHDACGIGLVVNIDGKKEYRTLDDALLLRSLSTVQERMQPVRQVMVLGSFFRYPTISLKKQQKKKGSYFPVRVITASGCSSFLMIKGRERLR